MSEAVEARRARSGLKSGLLYGCLPLAALSAISIGAAWSQAQANLRERSKGLSDEVAAIERALAAPRPALLGGAEPGNAVDHYGLINLVFGSPGKGSPGVTAPLAPTRYSAGFAARNPIGDGTQANALIKRVGARDRSALTANEALYHKTYGPLADHIRDGLGKRRCDWGPLFTGGPARDGLNLAAVRGLANLMAYQAFAATGAEALDRALEIVAFGEDLARYPGMTHVMIGGAVKHIGLGALEAVLERGAPDASYQRAIKILGGIGPFDFERALQADRLRLSLYLAALGGERTDVEAKAEELFEDASGVEKAYGKLLRFDVIIDREWEAIDRWCERSVALVRLPHRERVVAAKAFAKDLRSAPIGLVARFVPDVNETCLLYEEAEARIGALRMLAAARLHRSKTGALPKTGAELKPYLGGALPKDPFKDRERPLAYSLRQGEAGASWARGRVALAASKEEGR